MTTIERNLARHAELLHSDERLVVHLAELHSPDREVGDFRVPVCVGCGPHTEPVRATVWPCRTWSILDEEVDR
jgi:hypothetical protein